MRERVTSEGTCKLCPRFLKVSNDGKTCEDPKCGTGKTNEDGTCTPCGEYLFYSKNLSKCTD